MRCEFSLNYFLHGEVTRFDVGTWIYTVDFDQEDNAGPQQYTEDELQKIISKPVVGIRDIAFVPYTGMPVFAYRVEIEVKAEIVHVFKHDSKLKWAHDRSLSTFCVPYNQIRPMKDDGELEGADIVKGGYLKKTYNAGSMFVPYVGCAHC